MRQICQGALSRERRYELKKPLRHAGPGRWNAVALRLCTEKFFFHIQEHQNTPLYPNTDQQDSISTMQTGASTLNRSPATASPLRLTSQ